MTQESKEKNFDLSKYQIQTATKKVTLVIEETGDEVELTIKQLSWSKRNQLISKCLTWTDGNKSAFNADLYVRECLKDMIIEAKKKKIIKKDFIFILNLKVLEIPLRN